jgi:predicted nucleic acid-binding protein
LNDEPGHCLVADSSVIIALSEINMVHTITMLNVELIVPRAVYEEVAVRGHGRPGSRELEALAGHSRVRILTPRNRALVEELRDTLGVGESEAIALAVEHNCIVLPG